MLAGNLIMVMWTPVPGAVKYKVLLNGKEIGEAVTPPYQVPTPEAAGDYEFKIIAVDAAGKGSPPSVGAVIKVMALIPPKGVTANLLGDRIALRWDAVPGAAIYNVFRSEKKGVDYTLLKSVDDTKLVDPTAEKGKTYHYVVTSRDVSGKESKYSEAASIAFTVAAKQEAQKKIDAKVVATKFVREIEPIGSSNRIGVPVDIAVDKQGLVYVLDSPGGNIKVLDDKDEVVKIITPPAELGVGVPAGLCMDKAENLYVAFPRGAKVVKFAKDGAVLLSFAVEPSNSKWNLEKMPKEVVGNPPGVIDVAVMSDGRIVVADQHFARIAVYDAQGKFQNEFGRRGSGEGEFGSLLTIAVDANDNIYVGDPGLRKIFKFSKDLKPAGVIGNALPNAGSFLGIRGMAFDPQGRLVVSDPPMFTVQAFDTDKLDYLFSFGDESGKTTPEGTRAYWDIVSPSGIAFDAQGRLYIGQPQNHSVLVREIMKK